MGNFPAWFFKDMAHRSPAPRQFLLCRRNPEFCFFFNDNTYSWELERNAPRKTSKKRVFRCNCNFEDKTSKCMFCDVVVVLTHQRVYVLQVVVTVASGYGFLTGFYSFFYLFETCKTAGDEWEAILHRSDGRAK